jgi:molybdenum cofactor biosynthesis enzyme MoaA
LDHKKKFWLFKQSKTFCAVPWNQFEVFVTGELRTCCNGIKLGNINEKSVTEILNSELLLDIKTSLANDQPHKNCNLCYKGSIPGQHEDLRMHYNPMFQSADINYDDNTEFKLNALDMHWDNTCNFKCIYCTPVLSSSIAQEQKVPVHKVHKDRVKEIIELAVTNQYNLKEIYFSGGEPLLIKHNAELLSQLENKNIPLRLTTNLSQLKESNAVFKEVQKFSNVLWTLSADAEGARFNYIRHGGEWSEFLAGLKLLQTLGHRVRLNMVHFVGNAAGIFDTIKYFVETHGITDITVNPLHDHEYLLPRNAPNTVKSLGRDKLAQLLESNLIAPNSNSYYNILKCGRELELPIADADGYCYYFDQLDTLSQTNCRPAFPELT